MKMKKFITTASALAMLVSMGITAAAAAGSETSTGKDTTINVEARYTGDASVPDVVSMDITWGAMQFTYTETGTRKWDASSHSYVIDADTGAWSASGNTVKVTNHSNVATDVNFVFAADAGNTVTGSFTYDKTASGDTVALAAGEEDKYAEADNVTATLMLDGSVPSTQTDFAKVGVITVSISKTI